MDNIDDHVVVPGASAGVAGGNQITLMCWVKPMNTNITVSPLDYDGFAGIRNNTDADFYLVHFGTTAVEARFRNSSGTNFDIVDNTLQIGAWQHFALRYNGSELTLFKNGVQLNTIVANGNILNAVEDLYIGGMIYQTSNFYLKGMIDEVSLWNRALSPQEINCYMRFGVPNGTPGLLNYYKCNQGTAGGVNTGQNILYDQTGGIDGNMLNFALTGTTSNFVTGVATVTDFNDTYCSGGSYTFGSQVLTAPGVYTETFQTAQGCDSTVRLTLVDGTLNTTVIAVDETLTALAPGLNYQWIDCQNGNQPVQGATAQSFTPTVSSDYAVIVSNGICSDTSACNMVMVGIKESQQLEGVKVFPNPVNDFLVVRIPSLASASVVIMDMTGRIVLEKEISGTELRIPTESWSKGVYTVEVKSGDRRSVQRVSR